MKFEVEKGNFTITFNDIFRAEIDGQKLSPEAWGVYVFMLSLPEDWDYTIKGLSQIINAGEKRIGRIVNELRKAGFIVREQTKDEHGKFSKIKYKIMRKTTEADDLEPFGRFGRADNPLADNGGQQSTKELNTNITNISNIESNDIKLYNGNGISNKEQITLSLVKDKIKLLNLKKIKPETFFSYYEFENWKTKSGRVINIENLDNALSVWDSRESDNYVVVKDSKEKPVNKPEWIDRYLDELNELKAVNDYE